MRIALGTISKQKKKFLEEVLSDLKVLAVIEQYRVLSDLSDEFIDDEKVKQNSINRAKKALQEDKKADFSLGIECGYHPNSDEGYEMFCWATLIDKKGKQTSSRSNELLPPVFCQRIKKENKKLNDFIGRFLVKSLEPVSKETGKPKPMVQVAMKKVLSICLEK